MDYVATVPGLEMLSLIDIDLSANAQETLDNFNSGLGTEGEQSSQILYLCQSRNNFFSLLLNIKKIKMVSKSCVVGVSRPRTFSDNMKIPQIDIGMSNINNFSGSPILFLICQNYRKLSPNDMRCYLTDFL